jgi:site-specific DNA-cytosine methylase
MKVLELFAGSRSIGKVADELGYDVFSVDINNFDEIDLVKDIEFITKEDVPFIPDVIWASPPCTTYSIAAISHHRDMGKPKTDFAAKSDRLVLNTLSLIKEYDPLSSGTQGLKGNYERSKVPKELCNEILLSL